MEVGRAQGKPYRLPFVLSFYKDLYLPEGTTLTDKDIERQWKKSQRSRYGSLHEVLFESGFRPPNWLNKFNPDSYIAVNFLWQNVKNETQAIVHFVTTGIVQLLPISEDLWFEEQYVRSLLPGMSDLTSVALYKYWVERMLVANAPPNESTRLRAMGLRPFSIPSSFDWRRYVAERESVDTAVTKDKYAALEHFINIGILETAPLPISYADAEPLLRAAADRFAEMNDGVRANLAYERYLLCPHPTTQGFQHAADLAYREQKFARALYLYRCVRNSNQPNFWTYFNGATCALKLGDYESASDWLFDGLQHYPRNTSLQRLFHDLHQRLFDLAVVRHIDFKGENPEALTSLPADVKQLYDAYIRYYEIQFPQEGPLEHVKKQVTPNTLVIVVFANCDLPQCTYYRVTQKLEQMLAIGVSIKVFTVDQRSSFLTAAATADIAIFYRCAVSVAALECLAYCQTNRIPTVYEIDDLVFDERYFPDDLSSYEGTITEEQHFGLRCGVALVREFIRLCDFGIASTNQLKTELEKLVRSGVVAVHRNTLPVESTNTNRALATVRAKRRKGPIRIFYGSGTKAHATDFHQQVEPALFHLMQQFKDVTFAGCGHVDVNKLQKEFPTRVTHVDFIVDREEYAQLLAEVDINIAVLHKNTFNDCKSEIKWLEAAALRIPSVVSDVAVYREMLRPGEDIVIAGSNPSDWFHALKNVVEEPALREAIGASAYNAAIKLYGPRDAAKSLATALCKMVNGRAEPASDRLGEMYQDVRPHILVVNVFFPPQAIGGATRIVAGEVMELVTRHRDKFDISVFCGNDEDAPAFELCAYKWHGVQVFSLNTPLREKMDWIHNDPDVRAPFEEVLNRVKPSLVHFHCIQRLGISMIEALKARDIPYVVTVHDAWWISDYQFLVDDENRLAMPWDRKSPSQLRDQSSASRLGALKTCLRRADAVLAVSDAFALIYQRAGIKNVRSVENGLPELPPLEPAPRSNNKLRLGHFGGTAYIKGLFLLKHALILGAYDQLELVVIDLSRMHGDIEYEKWGKTKVTILGRVPQEQIGWLYGQIDVLIAPSVWPESFGLVVREALHYGKWVVVGNRGALSEAVLPDVNGFIIDISDPCALPEVLDKLQFDSSRFMESPQERSHIKSMKEHSDEVCSIYSEILRSEPRISSAGYIAQNNEMSEVAR